MLASIYSCAPGATLAPVLSLDEINEREPDLAFQFIDANCAIDDSPDQLANGDVYSAISLFMQGLPPRLNEIATRHYWLGQSQVDIADDLGVTRSAVCHALAKVHRLGREFFGVLEH